MPWFCRRNLLPNFSWDSHIMVTYPRPDLRHILSLTKIFWIVWSFFFGQTPKWIHERFKFRDMLHCSLRQRHFVPNDFLSEQLILQYLLVSKFSMKLYLVLTNLLERFDNLSGYRSCSRSCVFILVRLLNLNRKAVSFSYSSFCLLNRNLLLNTSNIFAPTSKRRIIAQNLSSFWRAIDSWALLISFVTLDLEKHLVFFYCLRSVISHGLKVPLRRTCSKNDTHEWL